MPTTFNVISLGNQVNIDPTEGNNTAENASALTGLTFGTLFDPLWESVRSFSPGTGGYSGGTSTAYDQNNSVSSERFRIDGGPNQTFDSSAIYNATITYTDGSTANISAVVFQDTAGNTYLAPEFSANSDQTALEAGAIRTLTLNSLAGNVYSGMSGSRQTSNFAVCFAQGTLIRTPEGDVAVEKLSAGDLVETVDNGPQAIRWIGGRTSLAVASYAPISFEKGSLGNGMPRQRLLVSRQHRMLVNSAVSRRMFGESETLIAANKLVGLAGVETVTDFGFVTYWHFMCDKHEIVFANDAPAETLYLGAQARRSLSDVALNEIIGLYPELLCANHEMQSARALPSSKRQRNFTRRLIENNKKPIEIGC
ncbi:Hint domain-containing protein [Sulfitobacter sp. F26169L]|uniref:Hint domain-containing protein n=1 Tax=Sulfitobacter sp. F26169L TaxID=2996015 RepID=UPI002260DDFE|nr:Hint domain-containing protein [Sulfitobacter sp. F26169L]MCX7565061.1 Hint domain-containing protein [Sulfitobacter sp. F26169L]